MVGVVVVVVNMRARMCVTVSCVRNRAHLCLQVVVVGRVAAHVAVRAWKLGVRWCLYGALKKSRKTVSVRKTGQFI